MRKVPTSLFATAACVLAVSVAVPTYTSAQKTNAVQQATPRSPTTRSMVTVVRLKPDMVNEWIDLQMTEVIPGLKKGGAAGRQIWQTQVGNAYEYTIITPFPKWAAMDSAPSLTTGLGAEAANRLNAKLRKCVEVQRNYLTNRVDDLGLAAPGALVMRSTVRRVAPGKVEDYLSFYRAEIHPLMQKAQAEGKIAGATVAVRGVGAMSGELTTVTYHNKFADMDADAPTVQMLGQAAADKINAKGSLLAPSVQTIVRRFRADLSF